MTFLERATGDAVELADYGRVLARRWRTIGALTLLGIIVSILVTVLTPSTYASEAKLFIGTSGSNAQNQYAASQFTLARMPSYLQLDASGRVLRPVIRSLNLQESVQTLADDITLSNPAGTVTLDVTANSSSPGRASAIANAVANQLSTVIEALERTDSATGAEPVVVSVTQVASPQAAPVSPRPVLNVALGLIAGLVAGIVVALVRDQLDSTVRSNAEAVGLTGLSVLGAVQRSRRVRRESLLTMPDAVLDEARRLRANIALSVGSSRPVTVLSAARGDGRSTVAIALAVVAARSGLRTCLVEADLRTPSVRTRLSLDDSPGLTGVLTGSATLDDALVGCEPFLAVLPAGPEQADRTPDALLDTAEFDHLLDTLNDRYDAVFVDVPPTDAVSDGLLVARRAGAVLIVTRPGNTVREALADLVAAGRGAGLHIAGLAINCATRGSTRSVRNFLPVHDLPNPQLARPPARPAGFVAPQAPGVPSAPAGSATMHRSRTRARLERRRIPVAEDQDSVRTPL